MKPVTGPELCRALERKGWRLLRSHGSHRIYGKERNEARVTVPVHAGRVLKTGLVKHLMRLAGLTDDDL